MILQVVLLVLYVSNTSEFTTKIPETTSTNYKFYETPKTWNAAFNFCNNKNGRLVNIEDEVKDSAISLVIDHFKRVGKLSGEIWTGLHAITLNNESNIFKWSTCANMSGTFNRWPDPLEEPPSNHCMTVSSTDYKWNLRNCSTPLKFVCEFQRECGCYMANDTSSVQCADVAMTASTVRDIYRIDDCIHQCLLHVNGLDQCWGITFDSSEEKCYLHERMRLTNLCPVKEGYIFYRKACFSADGYAYNPPAERFRDNLDIPQSNCSIEGSMDDQSDNCNFTKPIYESSTESINITTHSPCDCSYTTMLPGDKNKIRTNMSLDHQIIWLRSQLAINKKTTSVVKRQKTSAADDRVSAKGIGYAGGVILVMIVGGIVCLDASRLVHDLKNAARTIRKFFRQRFGW